MKFLYSSIFVFFFLPSVVHSSECEEVGIMDVKNLNIIDTKMKNPNGALSIKSEYAIYIKTKNCIAIKQQKIL